MADVDISMFAPPTSAAATPSKSDGVDISMFKPPAPQPSLLDRAGQYVSDYASGIKNAATKFWDAPSGGLVDRLKTDAQTVGALASGAAAPITALVTKGGMPHTDNEGGTVEDNTPDNYIERKQQYTYTPTDPAAQAKVQLVGSVLKPVGDALHGVASVLSDDPEHQAVIADALGYAVPGVKGALKVGDAAAEEVAAQAPSIANHPAVMAANDLAGKYNVPLTKGQQVAQAATDLPASQTATAKALNIPYQTEARLADQASTPVGKALDNHFDLQQNTLAGHVQDVADALRKAGEDDAADAVEGTIKQVSPGVNAVSGPKLQRVVNKDLIDDVDLSNKLNDLNDLSGIIDQPAKGPIATPGTVGQLTDKLTGGRPVSTAIGAGAGGLAGFKLGAMVGHPFVGADIGAGLGAATANKLTGLINGFRSGSLDLGTVTDADLAPAAKELGISPDDLKTELSKPQNAPAVARIPKVPAQPRYVNDELVGGPPQPAVTPAAPPTPQSGGQAAAAALGTPAQTAPVAPAAVAAAPTVQPVPVISTPTQAAQAAAENIYNHLKSNKLQIVFNKVQDGSQRTMLATLKDEHLPEGYTSDTDKYPQMVHGKPITVWDLENKGWRSFHPGTVTSIQPVQ
jgi:hypothetical protein